MFGTWNRILCISPHPDDEVIGCGGTLAMYSANGIETCVVYVVGREPVLGMPQVYSYLQESVQACEILGVTERIMLECRSRLLQLGSEVLRQLVEALRTFQPEVVYIPHEYEGDRELRLVHEMGIEAVWMASSPHFADCGPVAPPVQAVLGYEVWTPMRSYQLIQDITPYMDTKVAALQAYQSQIEERAYDDAVQGLNRYRAVMAGVGQYAEAFRIYKLHSAAP